MFYLQEIGAPTEEEYKSNIQTDEAIVSLINLKSKHSGEILKKAAVILKVASMTQSETAVYNLLREYIMGNTQTGNIKTNSALFKEVCNVINKKGGRNRFEMMYALQEMQNHRIVLLEQGKFIWNSKRATDLEVLGNNRQQVITLLLDEEQAHIKQMLMDELKPKLLY